MRLKFTVTNGNRTVKVYKTELEYEVRLAGRPQVTYYTDDYDDAVGTAKVMVSSAAKGLPVAQMPACP